jgi:hypothetical protein
MIWTPWVRLQQPLRAVVDIPKVDGSFERKPSGESNGFVSHRRVKLYVTRKLANRVLTTGSGFTTDDDIGVTGPRRIGDNG